jgi:hypothetical protein
MIQHRRSLQLAAENLLEDRSTLASPKTTSDHVHSDDRDLILESHASINEPV